MGSIRLGEGHWATRLVALGRGQAALDGHGQGGKLYSDVLLLPVRRRWTIDLGAWRAGLGCVLSVLQRAEFRRWAHSRSLCLPKAAWAHSRGGPGDVRLILVELVAQQADRLLVANEGPAVPLLRQLNRRRPPPLISGPMRLTFPARAAQTCPPPPPVSGCPALPWPCLPCLCAQSSCTCCVSRQRTHSWFCYRHDHCVSV